jgi:hypothetical protein
MGSDMVIVFDPFPRHNLGRLKTVEDFSIKKVVSKGAVKAFTKTIFPGAARFNVGFLYSNTCQPTTQLFGNKFWAGI